MPLPFRHPRSLTFFGLLALLLALLAGAPAARAADLTAATEAELVTAIEAVNAAGAGNHTITLTADITLTAPLPALDNPLGAISLDGGDFTLDGGGVDRVLVITTGSTVTIAHLTITGGVTASDGGGINNRGDLLLDTVIVTGNSANRGGGIFNDSDLDRPTALRLVRSVVSDNEATLDGGGIASTGNHGQVTVGITESIVRDNRAEGLGGGILSSGFSGIVTVHMTRSTLAGNTADYGGGAFLNGNGGEATMTVEGSAITGNGADLVGGGVFVNGNHGLARLNTLNSTLSGNSAVNGGGIQAGNNGGTAQLTLDYTTVAANPANTGSAVRLVGGASAATGNSILAGDGSGSTCILSGASTLLSGGYNLGDDGSCALTQPTDLPGGDPALLPLALNAPGSTATHALGEDSDAQRRIPQGQSGCGTTVTIDQRDATRPVPANGCDIGAYESMAEEPQIVCEPPYLPASEAALNEAIACINAAGPGSHLITLAANIPLTNAATALNNPAATALIIDGDGHILDGNDNGPILSNAAGTRAIVRDVTLTDGEAQLGAGIFNQGVLTVENSNITNSSAIHGGALYSTGNLTVAGSTLSTNSADYGGAISLATDTAAITVVVRGSVIAANTAQVNGGGIYGMSTGDRAIDLTLTDVTVEGNQSPNGTGGADLIAGDGSGLTATIAGSRVLNNNGYRGGVAVITVGGTADVTIAGSTVAGNRSTAQGGVGVTSSAGGVYARANAGGTTALTLFNSTLSGNSTGRAGGGLLVAADGGAAGANVVYSTVAGNTANGGGGGIHTATANGGTASVLLATTIVYNGSAAGPDCARPGGSIISTGYNLAGDGTCFLNQGSDQPAANPLLLALNLNAPGDTPTHALGNASPARDRVPMGGQGCGTAVTTDQRGAPRPQPANGRCDVGAYEAVFVPREAFRVVMPVVISNQ